MREYGDALVCVRYRYDQATRTRLKTVELIVERKELTAAEAVAVDDKLLPVQIEYGEWRLGKLARSLGGAWDPESSSGAFRPQRCREPSLKSI